MPISAEVASIALSVAAGVIKLGRRLDEIMAEEAALRSSLAVPFPTIRLAPTIRQMKDRLRALLAETAGDDPDPLGDDRATIEDLVGRPGGRDALEAMTRKYGLADFDLDEFDPDEAFRRALTARNGAWNLSLSDDDVRRLTYFVAAGADHRENSLHFRLAATVIDVLAEFTAEHARLVVGNPTTRHLLEVVLRRFSEPDLATMTGWGPVVRHAVRATANGLVDARDLLAQDREWLEVVLTGIARGRDLAPNGDDFVVGLFRGEGFGQLVRGMLEEGSARLLAKDASVAERILGEVLGEAARRAEGAIGFETFFQEQWHLLAAAGLNGLATHGRGLIEGETPLLQAVLVAAVDALADEFAKGPPTATTLTATVETMIAVVADDPSLLSRSIGERWLVEFLGAVAETIRDEGLTRAFGAAAVERYARDALTVMSLHPEILVGDSDLLRQFLGSILGGIATVEVLSLESIGDATVIGALEAVADNVELIDGDFAPVLGDFAGRLATLVAERRITRVQVEDLVRIGAEVIATNPTLFVEAHRRLAGAIVETVLDVSEESGTRLLAGGALIATIERILFVMSARGAVVLESRTLEQLAARLREVLEASLARAREEVGARLDRRSLPAVLSGVIDAWARGDLPDPGGPDFAGWFRDLAEELVTAAG